MASFAKLQVGAAVGSLLLVSLLVVRVSAAAFSATTENPDNTFAAGDVAISDDDGGDAASRMFALSDMTPGSPVSRCINVTYDGSMDAGVRLYGTLTGGTGLADYIDLTVERSTGATGGTASDCTGFDEGAKVAVSTGGDLGAFLTAHADYATGADTWAPTGGSGATVSYRFTVDLQNDDQAQGKNATVTFTWEAQGT